MPIRSLLRAGAVALAVASLAFTGCKATIKDPKTEGYVPIFDGKTLAGWAGRSDLWTVKEGLITGTTHRDHPIAGNTFLVWTNGTVSNFELRLQYRIFNGNSGIQYRSKLVDADKFVVGGYQADFEAGKTYSGILYEERGRGILAERGQRTVITDEVVRPRSPWWASSPTPRNSRPASMTSSGTTTSSSPTAITSCISSTAA